MVKVITYGTFDLLHYGHIRLLERAKALGDYLIVGVTADDFDKTRGKINVQQSLMERIEAVRATGLADEIIVEEYEGQKIDDIRRYDVDIFTVGSDWVGKFDYLNEYCKVVYLERTQGVSSTEIRAEKQNTRLGLIGNVNLVNKIYNESKFVNGVDVVAAYTNNSVLEGAGIKICKSIEELLPEVDAVYIASEPSLHFEQIKYCIDNKRHVLCETPSVIKVSEYLELKELSIRNNCILMDSLKTAYSTAYNRLLVLLKSGKIGEVVSVDATCTSLTELNDNGWNCMYYWGPTALLPVFNILGTDYRNKQIVAKYEDNKLVFVKMDFIYSNAVASAKVGVGVKSEGDLVISGTKGYIIVPSPWWKTDYFEIRYENQSQNKRYFYQLDGEGIRYELVAFAKNIQLKKNDSYLNEAFTKEISSVIEDFDKDIGVIHI